MKSHRTRCLRWLGSSFPKSSPSLSSSIPTPAKVFQDGKLSLAHPTNGGGRELRLPVVIHTCCYCSPQGPCSPGCCPQTACHNVPSQWLLLQQRSWCQDSSQGLCRKHWCQCPPPRCSLLFTGVPMSHNSPRVPPQSQQDVHHDFNIWHIFTPGHQIGSRRRSDQQPLPSPHHLFRLQLHRDQWHHCLVAGRYHQQLANSWTAAWLMHLRSIIFCHPFRGESIGCLQTFQHWLGPSHLPMSFHPMHPSQAAPPHGLGGSLLLLQIFLQQLDQMDRPTLREDRPDGGGLPCQAHPEIFPQSQLTPRCLPIHRTRVTWTHGCLLLSHP